MKKEKPSGGDNFFPLAVSVMALALIWKALPYLPYVAGGLVLGLVGCVGALQDDRRHGIASGAGTLLNIAAIAGGIYFLKLVPAAFLFSVLGAVPVGAIGTALLVRQNTTGRMGQVLGNVLSFPLGRVLLRFVKTEKKPVLETEGFTVGLDGKGKPFRLTEKNLGYHVQVIAPTGSGKTNLLKNLLENRIRLGHGIVFLDYKGDSELLQWAKSTAYVYGRSGAFRQVNLAAPETSVPYNPLSSGEPIELHSQLMNSMTWSEDFYRKMSSSALLTVLTALCEHRTKTNCRFNLGTLHRLLSDQQCIATFASSLNSIGADSAPQVTALSEEMLKSTVRENLLGLVANLHLICASSAGKLFATTTDAPHYELREGFDRGDILFFLINSLKLKESAQVLGRLILQDLMQQIGERYHRGGVHRPVTLIVDEFASFATPDFIEFMDRARGAGVGIVFAHQSRSDLDAISPEFKGRIESNANTTILSGVRDPADAEHFAGMVGTRSLNKTTVQTNRLFGLFDVETGLRSNREAEEFIVHPNELKALNQGRVFVLARTIDARHGLVTVPQASLPPETPASKLVQQGVLEVLPLSEEKGLSTTTQAPSTSPLPVENQWEVHSASETEAEMFG